LLHAYVVLADGSLVRASSTEHEELFWRCEVEGVEYLVS